MVKRFWKLALVAAGFALVLPQAALAEPRIALVMGNSAYGQVSTLDNPDSDARLIADTLTGLGFDVHLEIDATQIQMKRAIAQFGRDLRNSGADTTGLFYYAGHGVQSFGNNYLLPVDVALLDAADLDLVAVEAQSVLRQMASARNRTNIVILDACRNNPFETVPELNENGLAEMKAPTGSFLSYATAPGEVAFDGEGQNSAFTAALAKQMQVSGQLLEQAFKNVRRDVLTQTGNQQTPWDTSSLVSDFKFQPSQERRQTVQATFVPAGTDAGKTLPTAETLMFREATDLNTQEAFDEYLRSYPGGRHVDEVLAALRALDQAGTVTAQADAAVASIGTVSFNVPLGDGAASLAGRTVAEIINGSPEFPPIEGLPEAVWKGQSCSSCHQWTRDRLCAQGQQYQAAASARSLHKPHPFGGRFKAALRSWAENSCE